MISRKKVLSYVIMWSPAWILTWFAAAVVVESVFSGFLIMLSPVFAVSLIVLVNRWSGPWMDYWNKWGTK